jgi:hypothetical protein
MRTLLITLFFFPFVCLAQFTDDFSDGDFTNNPEWSGNSGRFIVNSSNELQLNDSDTARISYLSTASEAIYDASWEFLVKMRFKPSSSNYCDVYLISNTSDLANTANGYFVRVGSSIHDICLYRKDASGSEKIIGGTAERINKNTVNVKIKITRDLTGNWTLFSDILDETGYFTEGTVFDNTYIRSSYSGVKCVYTKTRAQHFHFDDFVVTGNPYIDNEPPALLSCKVLENNKLLLSFDEELNPATASDINNYSVSNGIGNPSSAVFYELNASQTLLEFTNEFESLQNYVLTYENISDVYGNSIGSAHINFSYVIHQSGMIVINEIMAKPDPVVSLPDAEYVELYNTTDFSINLKDWVYQIGSESNKKTLSEYILEPGAYLILCHANNVSLFESYGNTLEVSGFPTINNTGQTITLYDDSENIIDQVTYSGSWFSESAKKSGGWSLEKIDPSNDCSPESNWDGSVDERGGTPGIQNSIFNQNPDNIPPAVLGISLVSASEINVIFSEATDLSASLDINNYNLTPDFGQPIYAYQNPDNVNAVIIQFDSSISKDKSYILTVSNISDLCGNILDSQSLELSFLSAEEHDIIISEIMSRPEPVVYLPAVAYLELYNRTGNSIDITSWTISLGNTARTMPYYVLAPYSYVIICNQNDIELFSDYENVVGVASFSLNLNSGLLTLRDKNEKVIHTVNYTNSWHSIEFKKNGGFSLEIIDLNNPCQGLGNWTSSTDESGGTPGRKNSVNGENPDIISPYPIIADVVAPDTLIVYFNETLKSEYANNAGNFNVEEFGNPVWIEAIEPDFSIITMKFDSSFEIGKVYYLNVLDSVRDCCNNLVESHTGIRFAIAQTPEKNDIAINEILFYPNVGGTDFVELYNRSEKVLDLKSLWLSDKNAAGEPDNTTQISTTSRLLLPGEYCAITTNTEDLEKNYTIFHLENLFQAKSIPSLPTDNGSVVLTDRYLTVIDEVDYDKSQHYKLLSTQRGVSLERINYNRSSDDLSNWHSASQDAGFATPGYQNSQYSEEFVAESVITLTPKVFSPDNDGYEDRLTISYKLDEPGYTATMSIYGSNGNFVTHIINNEMLGMEGNLFWDGFDEGNSICPIGIYILHVEMFSLNGKKVVEKHAVVLSRKK